MAEYLSITCQQNDQILVYHPINNYSYRLLVCAIGRSSKFAEDVINPQISAAAGRCAGKSPAQSNAGSQSTSHLVIFVVECPRPLSILV
jgi:hypothetical protein